MECHEWIGMKMCVGELEYKWGSLSADPESIEKVWACLKNV